MSGVFQVTCVHCRTVLGITAATPAIFQCGRCHGRLRSPLRQQQQQQAPRSPFQQHHVVQNDTMSCPTCTYAEKRGSKHCSMCGTALLTQTPSSSSSSMPVQQGISCPTCTYAEKPGSSHCSMCGTLLPTSPVTSSSVPSQAAVWVCVLCSARNMYGATRCRVCRAGTPGMIGRRQQQQLPQPPQHQQHQQRALPVQPPRPQSLPPWSCDWCTFAENPDSADKCKICFKLRGTINEHKLTTWSCAFCTNLNTCAADSAEDSVTCSVCEKPRNGEQKKAEKEEVFGRVECMLITPFRKYRGILTISLTHVTYFGEASALLDQCHGALFDANAPRSIKVRFPITHIKSLYRRSYMLRDTALEFYLFFKHKSYFFSTLLPEQRAVEQVPNAFVAEEKKDVEAEEDRQGEYKKEKEQAQEGLKSPDLLEAFLPEWNVAALKDEQQQEGKETAEEEKKQDEEVPVATALETQKSPEELKQSFAEFLADSEADSKAREVKRRKMTQAATYERDRLWKTIAHLAHLGDVSKGDMEAILRNSGGLHAKNDSKSNPTERWRWGRLSNFDYLVWVNRMAGRSTNDITQYPVFPWVLTDFKSANIDLSDKSVYRDLSKPVGCLNPDRWEIFKERYEAFCEDSKDGDIPPFMYGSHYSSASCTLYYLLRKRGFSELNLALQDNSFDLPDRLFSSMQQCWHLTYNNLSDVKELIPEFYESRVEDSDSDDDENDDDNEEEAEGEGGGAEEDQLQQQKDDSEEKKEDMADKQVVPQGSFLVNYQGLDLGRRQDKTVVGDVDLPPWAESPDHFINVMREALESEFVSQQLHHWIDLIFGYKQRGQAAKDAKNLFFYLTYPDAVDVDGIADDTMRRSTEDQQIYFGTTPMQLFKKPHPQRLSRLERDSGKRKSGLERTAEKLKKNSSRVKQQARKRFSAFKTGFLKATAKAREASKSIFSRKTPPSSPNQGPEPSPS